MWLALLAQLLYRNFKFFYPNDIAKKNLSTIKTSSLQTCHQVSTIALPSRFHHQFHGFTLYFTNIICDAQLEMSCFHLRKMKFVRITGNTVCGYFINRKFNYHIFISILTIHNLLTFHAKHNFSWYRNNDSFLDLSATLYKVCHFYIKLPTKIKTYTVKSSPDCQFSPPVLPTLVLVMSDSGSFFTQSFFCT